MKNSNLKLRGYVSSRFFLGEYLPQQIQNLVIRDYCEKYNNQYLLSAVEYAMDDTYSILEDTINNISSVDGIICYSLFQLPLNTNLRMTYFNKIIEKNKHIHFALEKIQVNKKSDLLNCESIIQSRIAVEKNKSKLNIIEKEILKFI
tara:strand:- start:19 stop:459 length:441 start_codon:yes stop_codon:yes gene_type:complete